MRTIIAGNRGVVEYWKVVEAIKLSGIKISVVLSGTARGVDRLGERYARQHGLPLEKYPADWNAYGKQAGFIRNELMATKADALIAVWDGKSHGTADMIANAELEGLLVFVYDLSKE